jgi:putative glutamine amidotransferase
VHPDNYQGPPHAEGTPEDPERDATTLPLIRAAIAAGLPLLAICRGFQELNVALGGSLDQRVQDLPGRIDHSTPSDQRHARVRTAKAHGLRLAPGSFIDRLAEGRAVTVNSLHNQGIARLAPPLVAEGWAPDGTIEAVRVKEARGWAYGVQWHPEYDWQHDAISRRIFEAFGEACLAWAAARLPGGLAQAAE